MKIGIFDPYLDSLSGGEKYILTAAKCLSNENEVNILWNPQKEEEIKRKTQTKLGIDLSRVYFAQNIFSKKISLIERLKASYKYDCIIYLSDGSIPLVLSKLYIHFQFPVEWVNGKSVKTKFKLKRVNRVFCNSVFTKTYIDKKFNINSTVLYPPITVRDINEGNKENIILHVGRFDVNIEGENYKKQDFMVEVFKRMVSMGLKGWQFVLIIGVKEEDKNKLQELKKMAEGYPISIIENPLNEVLWHFYSRVKIYWHASGYGEDLISNPEKAEHFGMSTVEAMSKGAVPVAINAGGQKEIIENQIDGFLWDTQEELIVKTNSLINNENLWRKMSERAIKKSKIFSEERFCKQLKEIIS